MNQNEGKVLMIDGEPVMVDEFASEKLKELSKKRAAGLPIPPITLGNLKNKPVKGNPDRTAPPLTAAESDASTKSPDGWPTISLYERVQLKGIWFFVTRIKYGSGNIGLKMMTTEQVKAEGLKEYERDDKN